MTDLHGPFTSPDPRLEYDFDTGATLEIQVRENSDWSKVDPNVFRSWTGLRRINGEHYDGPNYYFLTNTKTER